MTYVYDFLAGALTYAVLKVLWVAFRPSIGTRSVLFGAHCFFLHPFFVARAWTHLYGFPWDPRLWIAFFVHDLGYLGKPNIDGPEGEEHPHLGARIIGWLFDGLREGRGYIWVGSWFARSIGYVLDKVFGVGAPGTFQTTWNDTEYRMFWSAFVAYHSRFHAKRQNVRPSRLCYADKLVTCFEPSWLYLPRVRASGELVEYMASHPGRTRSDGWIDTGYSDDPKIQKAWHRETREFMWKWVHEQVKV